MNITLLKKIKEVKLWIPVIVKMKVNIYFFYQIININWVFE